VYNWLSDYRVHRDAGITICSCLTGGASYGAGDRDGVKKGQM